VIRRSTTPAANSLQRKPRYRVNNNKWKNMKYIIFVSVNKQLSVAVPNTARISTRTGVITVAPGVSA